MESRKLINFGNSSFVISIPKYWIIRNNLKKGDVVYVEENGNNELILSLSASEDKKEPQEIKIFVDNDDFDSVKRKLICSYINGNDIIEVKGNISKLKGAIKRYAHNLIALEVVEETPNLIIFKNFLDIKSASINNLIRRIDNVTRSMLEDTKLTLDEDNFGIIYDRDNEVNSLAFLLLRVAKTLMNNSRLIRHFNVSYNQLLDTWILAQNIEIIADESKRISRLFRDVKLNKNEKEELITLFDDISKEYFIAMKSYYTNDKDLAYGVASRKSALINRCDNFSNNNHKPLVSNIIEKFKNLENSVHTVSRIVYQ